MVRTAPRGIDKPDAYKKETIENLTAGMICEENTEAETYPNIIFIQNESLYDLELITEKVWNEDPLAGLKELQEKYTSGKMISPTSGGGTCNVEYEILTAYPYYNTGGTPFSNQIKAGTDSLVSILKAQGYATEAIHFNRGDFFNRKVAYANLGFDKMVFSEDIEAGSADELFNSWFGDRRVYQELITEFENRDKSMPYFAHVVMTQNHGPYVYDYNAYGIEVEQDMDEDEKQQMQTYLNLEKESVESLIEVLEYFEQVEDPTILVFWGDHALGVAMFGISTDDSVDDYVATHLTPLLIWDNYGLKKDDLGVVSAYNISPYLLNLIGLKTDAYMNYMYENAVPNVLNEIEIVDENAYTYLYTWDEEQETVWNNVWLLQYDRMFGKKYSN